MHREHKEHESDKQIYPAEHAKSESESADDKSNLLAGLNTLSMGMRISDGPPPRQKASGATEMSKRKKNRKQPPTPPTPPQKNQGSSNPFASFMPMTDSEVEEAKLSLSEDEISSAIDTFGPQGGTLPTRPATRKAGKKNTPPVPGYTSPRSNSEDSMTEKVDLISLDPQSEEIAEISVEELVLPEEPERQDDSHANHFPSRLAFKLGIAAIVFILAAAATMTYYILKRPPAETPDSSLPQMTEQGVPTAPRVSRKKKPESPPLPPPPANPTVSAAALPISTPETPLTSPSAVEPAEMRSDKIEEKTTPPCGDVKTAQDRETVAGSPCPEVDKQMEMLPVPPPPSIENLLSGSSASQSEESPAPATESINDTVIIKLTGLPKDAAVTVDGVAMDSPFEVPRSLESMKVVVKAPDYETAVKRIVPGQDKAVLVRMKKK